MSKAQVVSPLPGTFYRKPSPESPPFKQDGDAVAVGDVIGLVEVMKTFSTVPYRATDGLPGRAKVVRWLVEDGSDVQQGDPILEVEPA